MDIIHKIIFNKPKYNVKALIYMFMKITCQIEIMNFLIKNKIEVITLIHSKKKLF